MKNNIGRKLVFYTHCEDLPEVKYNKTIVTVVREVFTSAGSLWEVKAKDGKTFIADAYDLYTFKVKEK